MARKGHFWKEARSMFGRKRTFCLVEALPPRSLALPMSQGLPLWCRADYLSSARECQPLQPVEQAGTLQTES